MTSVKAFGRPAEFGRNGVVVLGGLFAKLLAGEEEGDDGVLGVGGVVAARHDHVLVVVSHSLVKKKIEFDAKFRISLVFTFILGIKVIMVV